MSPHEQWPELLEEQAYLVQMLSEAAHDSGALEYTCALLDTFRADLRSCTMQVAELEREHRESSRKHHDSKLGSSASRFLHRDSGNFGSDKDKQDEDEDRQERLLAVWTKKRTLGTEVKNLEVKVQLLQRRTRHYDELQRRLVALYGRISDRKDSSSREENEAEEDTRRAQRALHDAQKSLDRHLTLTALLAHGDYALINAGHHLSAAGSGGDVAGVAAAKKCAVQTSILVDQARRLDPSFFNQEKCADVLKIGWLADVFHPSSPGDSSGSTSLLIALKPRHTALLSLIALAHKQSSEHNAAADRAAHRCSEARARRDALKRRALVARATADVESGVEPWSSTDDGDGGLEKDGSARMKDITAGLDSVIPVLVPPRLPGAPTQAREGEDRQQRPAREELTTRTSPPMIPSQPRVESSVVLSSSTQTTSAPSAPTPSLTPKSNADPRTQTQARPMGAELQPPPASDTSPPQSRPSPQQNRQPPAESTLRALPPPKPQSQILTPPAKTQTRIPEVKPQKSSSTDPPLREVRSNPQQDRRVQSDSNPRSPPSPRSQTLIQPNLPNSLQTQPQRRATQPTQDTNQPSQPPKPTQPLRPQKLNDSRITSSDVRLQSRVPTPPEEPEKRDDQPRSAPQPSPQTSIAVVRDVKVMSRDPASNRLPARSDNEADKPRLRVDPRVGNGSSGFTQDTQQIPKDVVPSPPSLQHPTIHGILKPPSIVPIAPRLSVANDDDPWGVKAAAATSTRPQPKLKTMFNLWRSAENMKPGSNPSVAPAPAPPLEPQLPPPRQLNARTSAQKLRFVDAVQVIPRPATDGDPYEDEDEDEGLPPSPRRGSMIANWLQDREGTEEGSGENTSNVDHLTSALPATSSTSSLSSTSSPSTQGPTSRVKPSPQSVTSPASALSAYSGSSIYSYYTTSDEARTPPRQQPEHFRGGNDPNEQGKWETLAPSSWNGSGLAATYAPPTDVRNSQRALDRTEGANRVFYDDLQIKNTRTRDADGRARFMSPSAPNLVPTDPDAQLSSMLGPSMTRSGMMSDHELLQTIFPSPPRSTSTISDRDLLFTP